MGLDDRDWYREALREREAQQRRGAAQPQAERPRRATAATAVMLACMLLGAIYADVRSTGAPLTPAGLRFWWSVRTADVLVSKAQALALLAVLVALGIGWLWRRARAHTRRTDEPWKRAVYNPKDFRRPRSPRR